MHRHKYLFFFKFISLFTLCNFLNDYFIYCLKIRRYNYREKIRTSIYISIASIRIVVFFFFCTENTTENRWLFNVLLRCSIKTIFIAVKFLFFLQKKKKNYVNKIFIRYKCFFFEHKFNNDFIFKCYINYWPICLQFFNMAYLTGIIRTL